MLVKRQTVCAFWALMISAGALLSAAFKGFPPGGQIQGGSKSFEKKWSLQETVFSGNGGEGNQKGCVLDSFTTDQGNVEDIWQELISKFEELSIYPRTKKNEVLSRIGDSDAVFSSKVIIDDDVMEACPNLKYIGVLATGYNNVDLEAATARGIAVTNVPAYSSDSVAQTVFAYLLHDAVGVHEHLRAVEAGEWQKSPDFCFFAAPMSELAGQNLVLVGSGGIGGSVGRIGAAFGMNVIFAELPGRSFPAGGRKEFPYPHAALPLGEALARADVVSLHCPLTPATARLVDDAFLAQVKPGAVLVNTGRGPLVDEAAAARALDRNILRLLYADVLQVEPPPAAGPPSPLLLHPRARVTPHVAWGALAARRRLARAVAANVAAFREGRRLNRLDG